MNAQSDSSVESSVEKGLPNIVASAVISAIVGALVSGLMAAFVFQGRISRLEERIKDITALNQKLVKMSKDVQAVKKDLSKIDNDEIRQLRTDLTAVSSKTEEEIRCLKKQLGEMNVSLGNILTEQQKKRLDTQFKAAEQERAKRLATLKENAKITVELIATKGGASGREATSRYRERVGTLLNKAKELLANEGYAVRNSSGPFFVSKGHRRSWIEYKPANVAIAKTIQEHLSQIGDFDISPGPPGGDPIRVYFVASEAD